MKIYHVLLLILCTACSNVLKLPTDVVKSDKVLTIVPDYTDLTIPCNIAPMNFRVDGEWDEVLLQLKVGNDNILLLADKKGNILFDALEWQQWLARCKGKSLHYTIYTLKNKQWTQWPAFTNSVAADTIDPYLCYRLIEPGYQLYGRMGIYQRNLTSFEERAVYETDYSSESHCINCHAFQQGRTDKMLFHVRNNYAGTVVVNGSIINKVNTKADSLWGAAVYPAWHPTQNKVAFSMNKTGQLFHLTGEEKIEVIDEASGLVIYDVDKQEIALIRDEAEVLENNPAWNPTGDTLYYTAARIDSQKIHDAKPTAYYNELRYDIMCMPYDKSLGRFGQPDTLFPASRLNKSVSFPRISPDGRYLLFAMAEYGQFHIWHKTADLYMLDFKDKTIRPLNKANSNDAESYHAWSSNSRWIVFSSRRDDGTYTRPYFAYIDCEGRESKAFVLPVEKPEQHLLNCRSYNVPELIAQPIVHSQEEFKEVVQGQQAIPLRYQP